MLDDQSRYAVLEDALFEMPDGRMVTYKRRRFLPQGENIPVLATVPLAPGDRLDLLTARNLGDPEQFWQICDANNGMHPLELLRGADSLRIPIPQPPKAL